MISEKLVIIFFIREGELEAEVFEKGGYYQIVKCDL